MYVVKGAVRLSVLSHSGKEAVVALFDPGHFFGGQGAVRRRLQPDPLCAREVRPLRAASSPEVAGISLRSATEPIDDTATGKLMEGVLAAFAQFDNDVRSDSDARRNAGGTGARAVRVPGTNRTHQCTARDDKSLMHGT
jgi:CRP-like cAMP-binding protein